MFSGIVLDVKGHELIERCETRATHHLARALECESEARLDSKSNRGKFTTEEEDELFIPNRLERKTRQHRERAEALMFLAKHIEPDKTYQVTQSDLRSADLLPDTSAFGGRLW